jgi:hypothetical protein
VHPRDDDVACAYLFINGALATLYAAMQDIAGNTFVGPNGFSDLRGYPEVVQPSSASQDPNLARRLWTRSAKVSKVGRFVPMQRAS